MPIARAQGKLTLYDSWLC